VLVVVALALFTGADKRAEAYLIGKSDIGSFEQNLLEMGIPIRATDARTSESAKKHLDAPVTTRKETGYLGYSESLAGSARKSGQKILVVFHADWCPSCKALETDIRANLASIPPDVLILKADFDAGTELRQKYGVTVQSTAISLNPDGSLAKKELCGTSLKALIQRFFPYP
jgi:thiol-disulfide isomerase/thioredoxin